MLDKAIRLSFSTNAFMNCSVYEALERIGEAGYEGVELLADVPHLYADSVTGSDLRELKAVLKRTGLKVANLNANTAMGYYGRQFWEPLFEPSLANPDRQLRRWRSDYSKKCIDMAKELNCPCVSLTSGRLVPGVRPKVSMDLLEESLRELVDYAADRSIGIGIEYEPGLLIENCEELSMLLDRIDSPCLGANLDVGHSHVIGEIPDEVIACLGPKIFHIHIEDIRARKHYHRIPGTGDMDFGKLFGILTDRGYEGFVTVELYTYPDCPEQAARQAIEFLGEVMNRSSTA